ncbi:MAG: HlyD family efflux transporter periplasmic adaptor subunit [Deltaproteobacteria bacterium]|nr:HlyD family efflux transporter periplasmic adaptor subunit [Deltaproteobacteria bacterium]MBK8719127.1 HlyD family efflux transporter periplasmic adaptor subunit [Deltaproteobacteria bacterium]MBP7291130.1 HlyD family efflux transporter periplasmic adaptor subunit [Nannocystaceae bacterium]
MDQATPVQDEIGSEQARLRALRCAAAVAACDGPAEAAARIEACIAGMCACDRVRCVFHDADSDAWWCERDGDRQLAPAGGVVGQVARSRAVLHLVTDARAEGFEPSVDDPAARGPVTVLAAPVTDGPRRMHAVMLVTRDGRRRFAPDEVRWLDALAEALAPALSLLEARLQCEAGARAERGHDGFRSEALEARNATAHGSVLRVVPTWLRVCVWTLCALALVALVGAATYEVERWTEGPALVTVHGGRRVAAQRGGTLASVDVVPGQLVRRGDLLLRLDDDGQARELEVLRLRLQAELRRRLRAPHETGTAAAVTQLQRELSLAETTRASLELRAPVDGVVGDVRARLGQLVVAGDELLTLHDAEAPLRVLALLPGEERGRLRAGQPLTLDLREAGGEQLHVHLTSVDDEVIGPSEARRYLGLAHADVLELDGPVVLATATLDSRHYPTSRGALELHDGMRARARVEITRETLLQSLWPDQEAP